MKTSRDGRTVINASVQNGKKTRQPGMFVMLQCKHDLERAENTIEIRCMS